MVVVAFSAPLPRNNSNHRTSLGLFSEGRHPEVHLPLEEAFSEEVHSNHLLQVAVFLEAQVQHLLKVDSLVLSQWEHLQVEASVQAQASAAQDNNQVPLAEVAYSAILSRVLHSRSAKGFKAWASSRKVSHLPVVYLVHQHQAVLARLVQSLRVLLEHQVVGSELSLEHHNPHSQLAHKLELLEASEPRQQVLLALLQVVEQVGYLLALRSLHLLLAAPARLVEHQHQDLVPPNSHSLVELPLLPAPLVLSQAHPKVEVCSELHPLSPAYNISLVSEDH